MQGQAAQQARGNKLGCPPGQVLLLPLACCRLVASGAVADYSVLCVFMWAGGTNRRRAPILLAAPTMCSPVWNKPGAAVAWRGVAHVTASQLQLHISNSEAPPAQKSLETPSKKVRGKRWQCVVYSALHSLITWGILLMTIKSTTATRAVVGGTICTDPASKPGRSSAPDGRVFSAGSRGPAACGGGAGRGQKD